MPDAPRPAERGALQVPPGLDADGDGADGEPPSLADSSNEEITSQPDAVSGEIASPPEAPSDDGKATTPPPSLEASARAQLRAEISRPSFSFSNRPSTPVPSAPPSAPRRPSRPLLASEALMEDLAPVEPLGPQARVVCVVAGVLFGIFGSLPVLGIQPAGRNAMIPSVVVGAVTLFAAVARVTYQKRAIAMIALGAIVTILGVAETGPARGIATVGAVWAIALGAAAAALPAALLFRARYRAFEGARLLLGVAFVASLPFAVHLIAKLVEAPTFGLGELGAVVGLAILAAGLPGFMGSETTAAGSFVALVMLVGFGLQAGLERLGALVPGSLSDVLGVAQLAADEATDVGQAAPTVALSAGALWDAAVTAVALTASAFLASIGVFQLLAWKLAPVARMIDVRKTQDSDPDERPSIEDWSTRS